MRYFDHDTSAGSDDKVMALRLECGGAAVDAYWCVLETLYREEAPLFVPGLAPEPSGNRAGTQPVSASEPKRNQGGYFPETETEPSRFPSGNRVGFAALAHRLCTDADTLVGWVRKMCEIGLLSTDVENPSAVVSKRAMANIERYVGKAETARQNGKSGGRKPKRNQSGTKAVSALETETEPAWLQGKGKGKGIGSHKGNQIPAASAGADAAGAAPPSRRDGPPLCPNCKTRLWRNAQTGRWECSSCMATFGPGEAVA